MEAAHIIPFPLNKFEDNDIMSPQIVCDFLLSSRLTHLRG